MMISSAFLLLPSIVLVSGGHVYQYTFMPAPTNYAGDVYPYHHQRPSSQVYFSNKKPLSQVPSVTRATNSFNANMIPRTNLIRSYYNSKPQTQFSTFTRTQATTNTFRNPATNIFTRTSVNAFTSSGPTPQLFQKVETIYKSAIASAGNGVVSQTKAHTIGLVGILREFAADPTAVAFVKENTADSSCIKSLDDAISATEAASDLIEKSGPEINTLLNTYTMIKDEKDTIALMKGSAQMMLTLDTLVPKLADFPLSTQCRVSPEATLKGMQEVANLVNTLAKNTEYPETVRSILKRSGSIVEASTIFTENLRTIFKKSPNFCSSESDYNRKAVQAIGDIFDEVTKLLNAVGSNYDLNKIRQQNINYASQLVETLEELRNLDLGFFDCNIAFSLKKTGQTLLEVADLVEEVGVDQLSAQLGINFNLEF